jgi:hypothetical protein
MPEAITGDVCTRLEQSPRKSVQALSHISGYSYSKCQRSAKKTKLWPHRVAAVHQLLEPDMQKQVCCSQWFQDFLHNLPGILDITWFTYKTWFTDEVRLCLVTHVQRIPEYGLLWILMGFMRDLCIWGSLHLENMKVCCFTPGQKISVPFSLKELWTPHNVCIFAHS